MWTLLKVIFQAEAEAIRHVKGVMSTEHAGFFRCSFTIILHQQLFCAVGINQDPVWLAKL